MEELFKQRGWGFLIPMSAAKKDREDNLHVGGQPHDIVLICGPCSYACLSTGVWRTATYVVGVLTCGQSEVVSLIDVLYNTEPGSYA